jgi:hypothetical protein
VTDISAFDSPIPYWINKCWQWPQLAQMALDKYSTPAMSDEPERVFSIAGITLNPRRGCLKHDIIQSVMCLRSWQQSGVTSLDNRLCRQAIVAVEAKTVMVMVMRMLVTRNNFLGSSTRSCTMNTNSSYFNHTFYLNSVHFYYCRLTRLLQSKSNQDLTRASSKSNTTQEQDHLMPSKSKMLRSWLVLPCAHL